MKRKTIWLTCGGNEEEGYFYRSVLGYPIDDGIMGVYYDSEERSWITHHVPTGRSLGKTFISYKAAAAYVRRIRPLTVFDWYSTDMGSFKDTYKLGIFTLMSAVGEGLITVEVFNETIMRRKMQNADIQTGI